MAKSKVNNFEYVWDRAGVRSFMVRGPRQEVPQEVNKFEQVQVVVT